MKAALKHHCVPAVLSNQSGFTLAEFMVAASILLVLSSVTFFMLAEVQQSGSYQTEMQAVLNNAQIAMQTAERYIRQAGNDPHGIGITGITIVSAREIKVSSDITGSAGPADPDRGDPDGDIADSGESVAIRFNARTRSLEIVSESGSVQVVAGSISGILFRYYDADGNTTLSGGQVRKVGISVSASSQQKDPRTGKAFGIQIESEIQISA